MRVPDDFDFSGDGHRPVVTNHAQEQWRKRVSRGKRMANPLNENTWYQAEKVYAPRANCDEQRLYRMRGHRDMLLCGHYYGDEVRIATVMYADYDRLETGR